MRSYSARFVVPVIAEALVLTEDWPIQVIDIGNGHGNYSLSLAQRYRLLTTTVFELQCVVPVVREIISLTIMTNRISVIAQGNFHHEGIGDVTEWNWIG